MLTSSTIVGVSGLEVVMRFASSPRWEQACYFGPFNFFTQRRWKKLVVTAQTRLEDRTRDLRLDKLTRQLKRMEIVLKLQELMTSRRGHYVSVQIMSRWRNIVDLNIGMGQFLHKYPHIFEVYLHPVKRNLCCKLTKKMCELIEEEAKVIKESEKDAVQRLKMLLMISPTESLHTHALWLIRRELGLPDDFRDCVLRHYLEDFRFVDPDKVILVSRDEKLPVAEVEKWREKEYKEKWLSEFETKYAFNINFPTGFKIEKGFREKLKNWQRLSYSKPYEKLNGVNRRSYGGTERFEKRAVGIIHEFLCITVEKMVDLERLSHFRKDFNMEVNIRELLLKHPGIFYISTKGNKQIVFLREAYSKGFLIEPNPVYMVRRKMLELILLGCRNTREYQKQEDLEAEENDVVGNAHCDWVRPILESLDDQIVSRKVTGTSAEETSNKQK